MNDSQIMPPPSTILAATIGITFVGPRNLPQKTMPGFLYINHNRVHDALYWLKHNNPIYRDIIILSSRLENLPMNEVLTEIMVMTKHSDDSAQLAEERDRYCMSLRRSNVMNVPTVAMRVSCRRTKARPHICPLLIAVRVFGFVANVLLISFRPCHHCSSIPRSY